MLRWADAREHQQLRRVDRAAAQDDFTPGGSGAEPAVAAECHADGAAAFENNLFGHRAGDDAEIGTLHRRAQIADGGRTAFSVSGRRLVVADAVLASAVEIVVAGKAELRRSGDEGLADRVLRHVRHAERTACAVKAVGAAHLVLRALEIRQYVLERPSGIAELAPMIEILGLATDVDHAVDRGRAAEHLAARPEDAAIGGARVRLGLVAPVDRRVGEGLAEAERNVDPAVLVFAACLDQHNPSRRVFAETRRHRAAGRAGADHDEVGFDEILVRSHPISPPTLPPCRKRALRRFFSMTKPDGNVTLGAKRGASRR